MRTRPILAVAFIAIPAAGLSIYLGFAFDRSFLGNLLAEIAGIALGALVGVFLLDKFIQQDRRAQWSKSRNYVLSGIAAHLSDAMTDIFIYIPISDHRPMAAITEGRAKLVSTAIQALKDVAEQMRAIKRSPSHDKHLSDYAIEWYEQAKWDLDQIQTVLTPRVIQSETEQELVDALMESGRFQTHKKIGCCGQDDGRPPHDQSLLLWSASYLVWLTCRKTLESAN